uniref:Uncharacterized protein n=2 Tax=Micrurus TaxID=8634 RepID=A0A2D4K7X4_9SAUR
MVFNVKCNGFFNYNVQQSYLLLPLGNMMEVVILINAVDYLFLYEMCNVCAFSKLCLSNVYVLLISCFHYLDLPSSKLEGSNLMLTEWKNQLCSIFHVPLKFAREALQDFWCQFGEVMRHLKWEGEANQHTTISFTGR